MISPLLGSFSVPFFAWWLFFVLSPPQTGGPPSEHGRRTDDSIAPQAQEPGETILYFPDYADGGGWSVQAGAQQRGIRRGAAAAPQNVDATVSALSLDPGWERLTSRGIPGPDDWTQ